MTDVLIFSGAILAIILAVMGGMIFSFLAGARVYRAGRENYPVNIIEPRPAAGKEDEKKEVWDNG